MGGRCLEAIRESYMFKSPKNSYYPHFSLSYCVGVSIHQSDLLKRFFSVKTKILDVETGPNSNGSNRLKKRCRQDATSHLVAPLEKKMSVASNWEPSKKVKAHTRMSRWKLGSMVSAWVRKPNPNIPHV